MVKRIFIFLFLCVVFFSSFAQDAITQVQNGTDLNVLYRNEATVGFVMHATGFGGNFRRIKHAGEFRKKILEFEFVNIRHEKETITKHSSFDNSQGFYFGKMLNFQTLRCGVGLQRTLYRKAERRSVEIRYTTMLGATIGFAKPVYLEILYSNAGSNEATIKTEKYNPENPKHDIYSIYGRASYWQGITETKLYPGIYAKFGLSFEYANTRDYVKAIEAGVVADGYYKVVPIMAFAKNDQVIVRAYLSFIWGKRWF